MSVKEVAKKDVTHNVAGAPFVKGSNVSLDAVRDRVREHAVTGRTNFHFQALSELLAKKEISKGQFDALTQVVNGYENFKNAVNARVAITKFNGHEVAIVDGYVPERLRGQWKNPLHLGTVIDIAPKGKTNGATVEFLHYFVSKDDPKTIHLRQAGTLEQV